MKIKLALLVLVSPISLFAQGPVSIDTTFNGLTQSWASGAIVNRGQIVKVDATGRIAPMGVTDTTGAVGVAVTSAQNSGQTVIITLIGDPVVLVDGNCAPGNQVSISATTAGAGHCSTSPSTQTIGVVSNVSQNNFVNVHIGPFSIAAGPVSNSIFPNGLTSDNYYTIGGSPFFNGLASVSGSPKLTINNIFGGTHQGGGLLFNSLNSSSSSITAFYINPGFGVNTTGSEQGTVDFGFRAPGGVNQIITGAVNSSSAGCFLCTGNTDNFWSLGTPSARWANVNSVLGTFTNGTTSGTFANLPAAGNGTVYGCSDCTAATNPCTGSGTGALAVRQNGVWVCK